jgi:hypothetical protein
MSNVFEPCPAQTPRTQGEPAWHGPFLALLPGIQRYARWAFRHLGSLERQEAVQAVSAYAAMAFARLFETGKAHVGYATPLARFGVRQHRAGRSIGGRINSLDVASAACQRRRDFSVEPADAWQLTLVEDRRATPAELAALRIDMADWLRTLSPRDRELASVLAVGEPPSAAARKFRVTRGRVSQLRRQLYESWLRFTGETSAG